MIDIVLDTNFLAEFLAQYFDPGIANRGMGGFQPSVLFSRELCRRINHIVKTSPLGISNLIITSTFAVVEIARKWDEIVQNKFSIQQFHTFTYQYPEWFSIAPFDEDLIPSFIDVPSEVLLNSKVVPIEWTDAVHLATVVSRGSNATLATSDGKAKKVLETQGRLIF